IQLDPDGIQTKLSFSPIEFQIDAVGVECLRLPHFDLVYDVALDIIAANNPGLAHIPVVSGAGAPLWSLSPDNGGGEKRDAQSKTCHVPRNQASKAWPEDIAFLAQTSRPPEYAIMEEAFACPAKLGERPPRIARTFESFGKLVLSRRRFAGSLGFAV